LIEVLNAASHLQVQTALDLCSEYMISLITFANADELLHIADTYSLDKVSEFYTNKVLRNFEEFGHTEQFLSLPANQLAKYLSSNKLAVRSEHLLYDMVARWYAHEQDRTTHLESLLKCIRFCLMTESQLTGLQQHWLTARYLNAMNNIREGLKFHTECRMGHPWLGPPSEVRNIERSLTIVHHGSSVSPFEITSFDHQENKFYQLITDISASRDCRVATLENFVYICRVVDCGGGTLLNSLLRFDPRHQKLQELTPCRRLHIDPALVANDRWVYILGGINERYAILDSIECYDITTNTWVDLLPLPQPTHSLSACVYKNKIYLSGGVTAQERQPTANLICFDPATQHWDTSKAGMHCARRLHEMMSIGNRLYVVGGLGVHSYHQQTQIPMESYDPQTNQWTLLTPTLAGRSIGHLVPFKDNIISIGREHYEATEDEMWLYTIETDTWKSYRKGPRRTGLGSASCMLLLINFYDERVARKIIVEK